ncbi:hypothetical protein J437_LFUL012670 [Ladona fulva]|uniref:Uncharacterized protein n=1 Tax=Ladona fulva TaxID=123851 RepID=A0A8K0KE43_LADFU|nr:hypothetical protein J437_LFUL012670 [Ladona fulva]
MKNRNDTMRFSDSEINKAKSKYDECDIECMNENTENALEGEEVCCRIFMGDSNTVVGEEGRVISEMKGLMNFVTVFITNTWFMNHKRWRYTWISLENSTCYQRDYILVED